MISRPDVKRICLESSEISPVFERFSLVDVWAVTSSESPIRRYCMHPSRSIGILAFSFLMDFLSEVFRFAYSIWHSSPEYDL